MNKIASILKNPFFTIDIAKARLQMFVYNHIQRMKAADNPAFVQAISDTVALWEAIFGNMEAYDEDKNARTSLTIQVNSKIKEFKTKVLMLESFINYKFKKKSGTYIEFYPHGRTEYYHIDQGNILLLFDRIITAATHYEAELGSDPKTEFTTMRDEFMIVFKKQKMKIGEVALSISDFEEKKIALCHQLYKNLLMIVSEYYTTPDAALAFFDESIVNWRKHTKEKTEKEKEVISDL